MKERKRPWLAALLAFFFGGPGFFYLGLRRGLVATLAWLLTSLFVLNMPFHPSPSIDPEAIGLFLLQAASAWLALLSCKRINAKEEKAAAREEPIAARTDSTTPLINRNPQRKVQADCSREIRDTGMSVIALSGVALFGNLMLFANTNPPMGEMGHFMHDSAMVCLPVSLWGVATGIGLMRAWRWAWISMVVFGSLLATSCTLLTVHFLLMPGGGMVWWGVLALRVLFVLLFLVPVAIGVRWFRFFLRNNVKSYFGISPKAPATPA